MINTVPHPTVKRVFQIWDSLRAAIGWRWVLHPAVIEAVREGLPEDNGALMQFPDGSQRLLGHPVRIDEAVTAIGVEWPDLVEEELARLQAQNGYQIARCGQLSTHAPHAVEHGPDQPRNCPGVRP